MVLDLGKAESVLDETPPEPSPAATISVAAMATIAAAASASPVGTPVLQSSSVATTGVVLFSWFPGFIGEQQLVGVSQHSRILIPPFAEIVRQLRA